MRPALILVGALGALAAFAAAPPASHPAGFGPVHALTSTTGRVDMPMAAVGPSGETVVMWRRIGSRDRDFQYVAAVGRDAQHLGRPAIVRAGHRAASTVGGATLLARPGGGFAACFGDDARRRTAVLGCSFSTANGRFGPLRVVERRSWRERPSFQTAMRADGKVSVVLSRRISGGRQALRSTTLNAQGVRSPLRPLATIGRQASSSLATVDDGTTAVAWSTPQRSATDANRALSLRLAAPGQEIFGASQKFLDDGVVRADQSVILQGGRELRIFVSGPADDLAGDLIVRRLPDGSFSAPLRLPRPAKGRLAGTVVALADGSPLAISVATQESETDCANTNAGVVGSGPLVSEPSQSRAAVQRLSKPGQIALNPTAVTLADGTVIASWQNAVDESGASRQEVAIRPSGASAFQRSQVLPQIAARGAALAAGGDQAVLAWVVGSLPDGPSHVVVSSLRRAPRYAAPAPLPKRPRVPCG